MKRSKKLDIIHSLLILIFSIVCIIGVVFLCYDKYVASYICWCVCILIVPCVGVLNFEYRLALRGEVVNEIKKIKSKKNKVVR